jgi:hypothetical protein
MSANNPLIVGVILMVVGVAFALLAYALLLGRKSEGNPPQDEAAIPSEPDLAEGVMEADRAAPEPVASAVPPPPPTYVPPPPPTYVPPPPPTYVPPPAATYVPPPPPTMATQPVTPAPAGSRLMPVATLLRDEVTGRLVVQVGQQQYASAGELKASKDWLRVERAASDLASWSAPPSAEKAAAPGTREEPAAPRPASMIEQINAIFERKLAASGEGRRGIRLSTGADGGVRVLIGLQPYPLDQVPDPEISRMIRESVAEWEKHG